MKAKYAITAGQRFGRLVVVGETTIGQPPRRAAICCCDCGNKVTVRWQAFFRADGGTQSCGCAKRRGTMSERFAGTRAAPDRLHNRTHGQSSHESYLRWHHMVSRCENPSHPAYHNYGGRGISVHPPWHDVTTFLMYLDAELGPRPAGHSLDRINNDGDYEPGNLRWATAIEQRRNQR